MEATVGLPIAWPFMLYRCFRGRFCYRVSPDLPQRRGRAASGSARSRWPRIWAAGQSLLLKGTIAASMAAGKRHRS